MKSTTRVFVLLLLAIFCTWGTASWAQAPKKPAGKGKADANGHVGAEAGKVATKAAGVTKACVELHNGGAVFDFDLTINPDVYPFTITGGTIKGSICDSPNWQVTGGSLGGTLTINGKHTGSGSCASTIAVKGTSQQPPSWTGTYTFDGSTTFNQHTLFLGYTACP